MLNRLSLLEGGTPSYHEPSRAHEPQNVFLVHMNRQHVVPHVRRADGIEKVLDRLRGLLFHQPATLPPPRSRRGRWRR